MDSERLWRSGNLLVMHKNAILPDQCVKTNDPAFGKRLKVNLIWHHPALYLLILLNLFIYAIVAIAVRKRAKVEIGVSYQVIAKRKRAITITWITELLGIGLFILGLCNPDWAWMTVLSLFIILGGMIWGTIAIPVVTAQRMEADYIWVKGVCKEFLASLPEWETR